MISFIDKIWHKSLGRPYRLAKPVDTGNGQTVILLHGIGRTGRVWQHVVEQLANKSYRVVAFDLLGFGNSPKPTWSNYDIDTHAQAIISSIKKLKSTGPVILVGHSMGCLVSVRIAHLRPDLVKHLVLYEMPLYEGLPEKRRYRLRTNLYFKFYKRVMSFKPDFTLQNQKLAEKLGRKIVGMEVSADTWQPFIKSLENTIMKQTAAQDIKHINAPMDVIYGSFDMLVIRGKPKKIFGEDSEQIQTHIIRARHIISIKASKFIVNRINVAMGYKGA